VVPNRLRSGEPGRSSAKLVLSIAMTANDNKDNSQPSAAPSESEPLSTDTPPANSSSDHASSSPTPTPASNRAELLDRARHFLSSPQVIHQDYESKRRFLTEKGLEDGEIQLLLSEMVRPVHAFPNPKHSMVMLRSEKAFAVAVARRATADVPRTSPVPSARPPRRHLQGVVMASGGLHGPALHLLRASRSLPSHRTAAANQPAALFFWLAPLAIPAPPPCAIGARPPRAQGAPRRPARQADGVVARV
jgi:hypothetical protein